MRLFKFLVISDEVMEKSKMIKPVARIRLEHREDGTLKVSRTIITKNDFYIFHHNADKNQDTGFTQYAIKNIKNGMVLMSIEYINEKLPFRENNKAYVIIDAYNVDEIMKLIAPTEKKNFECKDDNYFKGCNIKVCSECKTSKPCSNISMDIIEDKRYIRGKVWSYANDTPGSKNTIPGIMRDRTMEAKTGGLVSCSIHWRKEIVQIEKNGKITKIGFKPQGFERKAVYIPLHHWIKCNSVPNMGNQKGRYPFYHIGHIFDNRNDFIEISTKAEIEKLRKECEPVYKIRRGRRVLAAQENFSRSIKCKEECFIPGKVGVEYISNPKCGECEGVLYIDTKQGLEDLYNQLMSDEYRQLS